MDRKDQYKHTGGVHIDKIRERRRKEDTKLRKERRSKLVNAKRLRLDKDVEGDVEEVTISMDDVQAACVQLQKKGEHRLQCLQTLRKAFAQSPEAIDLFFSVESGLQCLVQILTGNEVEQQLEAAWCLTNLATGSQEQALLVAQAAAPYLTTFLSSASTKLQDQCAWAIGNLAGDSKECRDILFSQGCVPPLVSLLEHQDEHVAQSAAFALSNLARECQASGEEMVKKGVTKALSDRLKAAESKKQLLAELAWVLTYLSSKSCHQGAVLVEKGLLPEVVNILIRLAKETDPDPLVLTPFLRCLGNMVSGPDEYAQQACSNKDLLPTLNDLLHSPHRHISKETLWVLSNLSGEPSTAKEVANSDAVKSTLYLISCAYDIKQEALYLLCNLASYGSEMCKLLNTHPLVATITKQLKLQDIELLHMAVYLLDHALQVDPSMKDEFVKNEGLTHMERLEYHADEGLRDHVGKFLEQHFYHEKDQEAEKDQEGAKVESAMDT